MTFNAAWSLTAIITAAGERLNALITIEIRVEQNDDKIK
jgi:hypothetical protein